MQTITVTLYEASELREHHPKGFERALDKHRNTYWDVWGQESVQDWMLMEADRYGFPTQREVFYDLYGRGSTAFAGGPLTPWEEAALGKVFPDLEGIGVTFEDGRLMAWGDWDEDGEPYMKEVASEWLDGLYEAMLEAGRQEMELLESEDYFVEHAEANGLLFYEWGDIH